ncbi:MAG TPA: acyl-CoA dehydrogenase family protein [Spongiibacteraceae bacterium]|jgi:acyl-CoA dehydrogenase
MLKNYFLDEIERGELELFRESVRGFCEQSMAPYYTDWEKAGLVPRDLFHQLGAAGLLCVDVPEAYGGYGVPARFSFAIIETMGYFGFTGFAGGLEVHSDITPGYLLKFGSEMQKQYWLPRMVSGEVVTAIAMTEPNAGSDLKNIRTSARRDGDHYIINGSKIFISNGQHADMIVVAAKTDVNAGARGISLFLVDATSAGFARGTNLDKIGQKCADTSELFFSEMRVPADALLGNENQGFVQMMQELPRERLIIAVLALGAAHGALAQTLVYVQEREAFGARIAALQNTRFKLAELHTLLMANAALVQHGIAAYERGELSAEAAAAIKLSATEMQGRVTDECLQLFGGYGYMTEYPISRAWVDARVQRIYGGTSEIMKEVIARGLLPR